MLEFGCSLDEFWVKEICVEQRVLSMAEDGVSSFVGPRRWILDPWHSKGSPYSPCIISWDAQRIINNPLPIVVAGQGKGVIVGIATVWEIYRLVFSHLDWARDG